MRPGGVGMRTVACPHRNLPPGEGTGPHAHAIDLKGRGYLPAEIETGRIGNYFFGGESELLIRMVQTLDKMADPADVVLDRNQLQARETLQHAAQDEPAQ